MRFLIFVAICSAAALVQAKEPAKKKAISKKQKSSLQKRMEDEQKNMVIEPPAAPEKTKALPDKK